MGNAGLGYPPEPERSSRPGTPCVACGMPARKRIAVKKPGWRVAEDRDVCDEHYREFLAQIGDLKKPSTLIDKITTDPAPIVAPIVEELQMPEPIADASKPNCQVPGCTNHQHSRGLCGKHYDVNRRTHAFEAHAFPAQHTGRGVTKTAKPKAAPPAPSPQPRVGTPPAPKTMPTTTTATPRFVVRLGALIVECRELADVVELHRALGGG